MKELRILAAEEETQLVRRVLRVLVACRCLVVQRVPIEQEAKLGQGRVPAARHVEAVDRAERVVGLHLGGPDVGDVQRPAFSSRATSLRSVKVLGDIERPGQPQVAELGAGVRERDPAEDGVGPADGHDVNVLAVGQLVPRNPHDPILVRHQVGQAGRPTSSGSRGSTGRRSQRQRALLAAARLATAARAAAADLVVVFPAGRGLLLAGVGVANRPRVQQQPGPSQHVAGERGLLAAFEDVTILVADVAAAEVEVAKVGARQHRDRRLVGWAESAPRSGKTGSKRAASTWTRVPSSGVDQVDDQIAILVAGHVGDVERQVVRRFEDPALAGGEAADHLAGRDADRDDAALAFDLQAVVARLKPLMARNPPSTARLPKWSCENVPPRWSSNE